MRMNIVTHNFIASQWFPPWKNNSEVQILLTWRHFSKQERMSIWCVAIISWNNSAHFNMPRKPEAYSSLGSSKRTIIAQAKRQLDILACGEGTQLLADILNSKWSLSIKRVNDLFLFKMLYPPPQQAKKQNIYLSHFAISKENHKACWKAMVTSYWGNS